MNFQKTVRISLFSWPTYQMIKLFETPFAQQNYFKFRTKWNYLLLKIEKSPEILAKMKSETKIGIPTVL